MTNKHSYLFGILSGLLFIFAGIATILTLSNFNSQKLSNSLAKVTGLAPRVFIVQSGSMDPAIKVGSVVVTLPQESYKPSDIITFSTSQSSNNLITHRALLRQDIDGKTIFTTKGDANEEADNFQIAQDQIVGKVALTIPYLGYAAEVAKRPQGFIFLVIVPATIIVYEELKYLKRELAKILLKLKEKAKSKKNNYHINDTTWTASSLGSENEHSSKPLPKVSILVPAFGALLVFLALTSSYFADVEKSLGNILGAAFDFTQSAPDEAPLVTPLEVQPLTHEILGEVTPTEVPPVDSQTTATPTLFDNPPLVQGETTDPTPQLPAE